jgi:hypothetical protein
MKKKYFIIIFYCFLALENYGQENEKQKIVTQDIPSFLDKFDVSNSKYTITHPHVLNYFFVKKINTYLSSSSNLTLSKGFAFIDSKDNRLFLGGTFTNRDNIKDKVSHIFQGGIKTDIKEDFSTIFSSGIQNNIGINLKYTLIGNGTLTNINSIQTKRIHAFSSFQRELFAVQMKNKINDFQNELKQLQIPEEKKEELYNEHLAKIRKEFEEKYIKSEVNFIEKFGNHNRSRIRWFSFEIYVPITKSEYKVAEIPSLPTFDEKSYYPWSFNSNLTNLISWSNNSRFFTSLTGGIFQNNSVLAKTIEEINFNQFLNQGNTNDTLFLAQIKSDKVYRGPFETFISYRYGMEAVFFFGGRFDWIGISSSIEWLTGSNNFNLTNYKFGIPVSLKDSEGKPKVNFELQVRKFYNNRSFGISVGVPFGNFVY